MRGEANKTLGWLDDPPVNKGIRWAKDAEHWDFVPYSDLAIDVRRAANELAELGVRRNDTVSIVLRPMPDFVVAFFGAMYAGAVPSALPPPQPFQDPHRYSEAVQPILQAASPNVVIAESRFHGDIQRALEAVGEDPPVRALTLDGDLADGPAPPAQLALAQFTSGSSGRPCGVPITFHNLEAQLAASVRWLRLGSQDAFGTWLPLHHDMGLIGTCLLPVVFSLSINAMRPDQFVRSPLRWLEGFGRHGATISAAPNFGLTYTLDHTDPEALWGMDFSRWRHLVVGAERVDPAVLRRFTKQLEPFGFHQSTLRPAYGLAEATLAVSGSGDEPLRIVRPDSARLAAGAPLVVEDEARLDDARIGDGAGWMVSCGRPLEGVAVRVVDPDGLTLAEGHVGEVAVRGPSIARGYFAGGTAGNTRFEDGELLTGDAGFFLDGELFIIGRIADSLKVLGHHVYAEDLEAKAAVLLSLRQQRVAALLGIHNGRQTAGLVVAAAAEDVAIDRAEAMMRREVGTEVDLWVLAVGKGGIPRTSSGKIRRRELWRSLLAGDGPGGGQAYPGTVSSRGEPGGAPQ